MKKLLFLILPFLLVACGDDKHEPRPAKLDGCYYLSHTKIEIRTPVGDDMGKIVIEPDKFTLEYPYTNPAGQILKKIFTYTHYPSFNKVDL